MLTWHVCDFLTGQFLAQVFPRKGTVVRRLGESPTNTTEFNRNDMILTAFGEHAALPDTLVMPWSRQIVACWNNRVAYAGVVMRSEEDELTGDITVRHQDIRGALLPRRSTLGEDGYSTDNYADRPTNYSKPTLIKVETRLIQEGPTEGYVFNFSFDYVDPLDPSKHDGTESREYFDYNLPAMDQVLGDLERTGVETDYFARKDGSGNVEWVQRVAPSNILPGTLIAEYNLNAPQHGVQKWVRILDGASMATNVTVAGMGSGLDRKFAFSRADPPEGFPALEANISVPDEADEAVLFTRAEQYRLEHSAPAEQRDLVVMLDGTINPADLNEWMNSVIYILRGQTRTEWRVIGFTLDPASDLLPLEVQQL